MTKSRRLNTVASVPRRNWTEADYARKGIRRLNLRVKRKPYDELHARAKRAGVSLSKYLGALMACEEPAELPGLLAAESSDADDEKG